MNISSTANLRYYTIPFSRHTTVKNHYFFIFYFITAAGSGERNVGKSHKSLNIRNYLIDEYRILKLACLYITSCVHGHTIDFLMVKGNPPFLRKLLALFAFYNFRTSVGVTA